ncbi:flagellar assembly protein FliW [Thermotalea metallivorans]|uniref:Flagellar assembly factor FliW n=1 Tax=Thermotalea metallivorans TaxID=520762 RepID=A0A140L712_9FIRM|nr:flagellar assembly protein FliW [Thermotalea metallivorans]KXG76337.1 Flagellar assembly factor FliW [Thermotalea metallivorans]
MKLQTKHFGEIEIDEHTVIDFPEGIPGFENFKRYVILKNPDPDNPFHWLQCVDDTDLAFAIVNPFILKEDYDFAIPDSVIEKLNIESIEDIIILTIVVIPEDIRKMTANLRAPLIINIHSRLGKQLILEDATYPSKYFIMHESMEG